MIKFGDIISNPSAGERNPTKVGIVVKKDRRCGRSSPGPYIVATNLKGLFWELSTRREIHVIGRIDADQAFRDAIEASAPAAVPESGDQDGEEQGDE